MRGARFRRVIVNRPNLRIPFPARFIERLRGQTVKSIARRGKYLTLELSSGETLIIHLGMSGWFHVAKIGDRSREADPHDHVAFVMSSGQSVLFNDPRRFGFMDVAERGQLDAYPALSKMGPEPLSPDLDARALARACRGKKSHSRLRCWISGWSRARQHLRQRSAASRRLSPLRKASTIATTKGEPKKQAEQLVKSIKSVLTSAIKRRGVAVSLGAVQGIREGRQAMPAEGLRRHDQALLAGGPIDLLLPDLPEVNAKP